MRIRFTTWPLLTLTMAAGPATGPATAPAPTARSVYESATRSLVIVEYTWQYELGPHLIRTPGVVVAADGTVMVSAGAFDDRVPEAQIKDVKILVPRHGAEPLEVHATYLGRDDRDHLAFVKATGPGEWVPLAFSPDPVQVGDPFYSVGLLGEGPTGYKPYLVRGSVAAIFPGQRTSVLTDGSVAVSGSPVLDMAGRGIGFVDGPPGEKGAAGPPSSFTPATDFAAALAYPGRPAAPPWLGVFDLADLTPDAAGYYGIRTPAVQLAALAQGGPAATAGLAQGDIVTAIDGRPLESGDTPEQVPGLFLRDMERHAAGDTVTLTVRRGRGTPPLSIPVKLGTVPPRPNAMPRFWADDLAFGVRDLSFLDRYVQHLSADDHGVIVSAVKPDGPAGAAHLPANGFVISLNGHPVADMADFQKQFAQSRTAAPQDASLLLVRANGQEQTIRVEPPR